MDDYNHRRTSTRLRIQQGNVVLRYGQLPSVACALSDLSEGGCRCIALLGTLAAEAKEEWKTLMVQDQTLSIEVNVPPHLKNFEIQADIRHVQAAQNGPIQFGLRFLNLDERQIEFLQKAILTFATEKVRGAFSSGERLAQQYIVGGGPANREVPPAGSDPAPAQKAEEKPEELVEEPLILDPPSDVVARLEAEVEAVVGTAEESPPEPERASETESEPGEEIPSPYESQLRRAIAAAAARTKTAVSISQINSKNTNESPPPDQAEATPEQEQSEPAPLPPPSPFPAAQTGQGGTAITFRNRRVGEILVHMNKLTEDQVENAINKSKDSGERLGRYLLRKGLVTPAELCRALGLQSGLPMTDLSDMTIPKELLEIFPFPIMMQHECIPFDDSYHMVCLAAANPLPRDVLAELERLSQRKVEVFLADEDVLMQHLVDARPKENKAVRKHLRYEMSLEVRYRFCNRLRKLLDPKEYKGITVDISEGGFMIAGPEADLGDPDTIRRRGACIEVTILSEKENVDILCGLAFIKIDATQEWPWQFGLKILEINNTGRKILKELCIEAGRK